MKNMFFAFLLLFTSSFAFAQDGAQIEFNMESFDFGELEEGPKVNTDFILTNTGNEPLILSNVKASCGCTVPSWPREPILPGEEATIKVTYNTLRRVGPFNKAITVSSNATESRKMVYIKGIVKKQEVEEEGETMPVKQPLLMAPE